MTDSEIDYGEYKETVDRLIKRDKGFKFLCDDGQKINYALEKIFNISTKSLEIFYPRGEATENGKRIKEDIFRLIEKKEGVKINEKIIANKTYAKLYFIIGDKKRFIMFYQIDPDIQALISLNDERTAKKVSKRLSDFLN